MVISTKALLPACNDADIRSGFFFDSHLQEMETAMRILHSLHPHSVCLDIASPDRVIITVAK